MKKSEAASGKSSPPYFSKSADKAAALPGCYSATPLHQVDEEVTCHGLVISKDYGVTDLRSVRLTKSVCDVHMISIP